nr:hypothetical protein OH820_12620 [Streptomyces sp. NBC_00857]
MDPVPHPAPRPAADTDDMAAPLTLGGFWRLAPDWVPRDGYAWPTAALLRDVEAGLRRRLSDGE